MDQVSNYPKCIRKKRNIIYKGSLSSVYDTKDGYILKYNKYEDTLNPQVHKIINDFIDKYNYPFLLKSTICIDDDKHSIMSKKADYTFYEFLGKGLLTLDLWKQFIRQIVLSIKILNKKLKIIHNDIKFRNLLVNKATNKLKVEYDNEKIIIEKGQYYVILFDYNDSQLSKNINDNRDFDSLYKIVKHSEMYLFNYMYDVDTLLKLIKNFGFKINSKHKKTTIRKFYKYLITNNKLKEFSNLLFDNGNNINLITKEMKMYVHNEFINSSRISP